MKHKRIFSVYIPVIIAVFLFISILCPSEAGTDKYHVTFGEQIAGTYLLTEADEGGSFLNGDLKVSTHAHR